MKNFIHQMKSFHLADEKFHPLDEKLSSNRACFWKLSRASEPGMGCEISNHEKGLRVLASTWPEARRSGPPRQKGPWTLAEDPEVSRETFWVSHKTSEVSHKTFWVSRGQAFDFRFRNLRR